MILGAALGAASGYGVARRGRKVRGVLVGAAVGAVLDVVGGAAIKVAIGAPSGSTSSGWSDLLLNYGPGGL